MKEDDLRKAFFAPERQRFQVRIFLLQEGIANEHKELTR
jgi:hypothetical protein